MLISYGISVEISAIWVLFDIYNVELLLLNFTLI